MKEIILLSALALVHGGAIDYNANGCSRDHPIEKLLPHEDCRHFYQCLSGILIPRVCPAGLYFDSLRQVCDWPQNTDCWNKQQEDINKDPENTEELDVSDPSQAPKICATPESNGVLVAHEICNKFYKCSYGKPVSLDCPLNLLYNPGSEQCDWPAKVDCGNRVIAEIDDSENDNSDNETEGVDVDSNENIAIYDDPSEAPAICKAEGSQNVLVAHENCNQYYICSQGLPVALKCPINLLYNPPKEYCDWPVNVDCGSRIIPQNEDTNNDVGENKLETHIREFESNINSDPSKAPSICAAKGSDSVLVAHENCNQFYKCTHGVPVALKCPATLMYNPEKEYCDWTANVNCGDRLIPDTNSVPDTESNDNQGNEVEDNKVVANENADPSEAPAICAAEGSDGVLVAHENCNQFYKCSEGRPVALSCPLNLLYNPSKEYCDWPQEVDCGNRVIPEPEDDNTAGGGNGEESGGNDEDKVPDQEINDDPSKAPEICAAEGSDSVLVAHENCNQFYKCSEGLPIALSCPLNLLYNPSKQYCDWPVNVDCGSRIIPQNEDTNNNVGENKLKRQVREFESNINSDPSKAPSICAAKDSDSVLVAHENCNQFYKCTHGVPVALKCPATLMYNPEKEYCDWTPNVNCGDRLIPDTNTVPDTESNDNQGNEVEDNKVVGNENADSSEAPAICAAEGSDGVLVAHENCNQFYKCSEGRPVAFSCPLNLLYNPSKEYCDWPQDVDCGNRVIPEPEDDNTAGGENGEESEGNDEDEIPDQEINDDPSKAPEICAAEGSDGVLVAHEICNQFYKCSKGLPVALSCPLNLLFNPSKQYCDWPQNVECGDRSILQEEDNNVDKNEEKEIDEDTVDEINYGVQAAKICADASSNALLAPHDHCDQFYKCAFGLPVALFCPSGLMYNTHLEVCDWPTNVECGSRGRSSHQEKRYLEAKKALKFLLRVY